jgi:formate hydrogenlyase transcriptional activator
MAMQLQEPEPGAEQGLLARLEALIRVSRAINVHRDPKELFRVLASELRSVVNFDYVALFLYDQAANKIQNPVLETIQGPGIVIPSDFPPEETITWWVYQHQEPLLVSSRDDETRFPRMMEIWKHYGVQAGAILPLTTAYRRLGSLSFGALHANAYSPDELRCLSLVAEQVALAIDNALRDEELRRSEAYLSEGQRLSHTGSWARNVATGDIFFSEESFRIFGIDAKKTKVTLPLVLSRAHPDDRPALEETIQKAIRDASHFETDYRITWEDGTIRHIHVLGHPVKNEAGSLVEFVGTHMDVTEQYKSRKALEDAFAEISALKDQLFQQNIALRQEIDETSIFEEIVGKSEALRKVLKEIETVGPTESTVLICGETGTGKQLIARAIHNLSPRRSNAFVTVNCAAIPTGLLESELFGHEKGAFTGAISQRIGRFELAHHGTVFLDEIGEIPLELQPKLLRVLQEREFERLGSSRTLRTDARLVAATNRDLGEMVQERKFRSDLFYRLNVFPLLVPALRERPEDVPLLVRHFAELFRREMRKSIQTIPAETMSALARYPWPGNVRELQNVIERAVILSTHGVLRVSPADLKVKGSPAAKNEEATTPRRKRIRASVPPLGRAQVLQALREAGSA